MTAGFYSPLPPARTGVADYAAALQAEMRRFGQVALNAPGAVNLYHLGNNQLHRAIYHRALDRPGVAVLHDAVLHHFFLGSLDQAAYVAEFTHNYGAWAEDLARALWAGRARSATEPRYFAYPMLRRIAESSLAVVVHNPAAARMVREHAPAALVREIPHLLLPGETPPYRAERLRRSWDVPAGGAVFGVFGHLRESKRIATVLRAFERVRRAAPGTRLLLAGEFASRDLERCLAVRPAPPGLIRIGRTGAARFAALLAAADVCVNLRYPEAGETSGIALRAMAAGKAVIVTSGEAASRFPEAACARVDPGPAEEDMLAETMLWLAESPAARSAMGAIARDYARSVHSPEAAARRYWELLRHLGGEA